ncbi:hypothetical protein ACJJTC_000087 [Scirpophaga incertulas]
MHCFEIRTANVDYLVGAEGPAGAPPPPHSGVGAYLARPWATALRHALLPVTKQEVPPEGAAAGAAAGVGGDADGAGGAGGAGGAAGEGGAPGGEGRRPEMAQVYQIFPDEVLGSGQFGIVYGGIHRRTQRPVAIKVP